VEDPLTGGQVQRDVARRREVPGPGHLGQAGAVAAGNVPGGVGGPGVDDDDLVHDPPQGVQAAGQEAFLVLHDHGGAEEGSAQLWNWFGKYVWFEWNWLEKYWLANV